MAQVYCLEDDQVSRAAASLDQVCRETVGRVGVGRAGAGGIKAHRAGLLAAGGSPCMPALTHFETTDLCTVYAETKWNKHARQAAALAAVPLA